MDCMAQTSNFSRVVWILMSLTNDDGHVNENGNNAILGLQPRDKAAMLGVKTKEYFLEEFT